MGHTAEVKDSFQVLIKDDNGTIKSVIPTSPHIATSAVVVGSEVAVTLSNGKTQYFDFSGTLVREQ